MQRSLVVLGLSKKDTSYVMNFDLFRNQVPSLSDTKPFCLAADWECFNKYSGDKMGKQESNKLKDGKKNINHINQVTLDRKNFYFHLHWCAS